MKNPDFPDSPEELTLEFIRRSLKTNVINGWRSFRCCLAAALRDERMLLELGDWFDEIPERVMEARLPVTIPGRGPAIELLRSPEPHPGRLVFQVHNYRTKALMEKYGVTSRTEAQAMAKGCRIGSQVIHDLGPWGCYLCTLKNLLSQRKKRRRGVWTTKTGETDADLRRIPYR